MTTYYESAEEVEITFARAVREYMRHGASENDLVADLGKRETYNAQEVLQALGY